MSAETAKPETTRSTGAPGRKDTRKAPERFSPRDTHDSPAPNPDGPAEGTVPPPLPEEQRTGRGK